MAESAPLLTAAKATRLSVALVTDAIAPFHRGGKEERYRELAPRLGAHADVRVFTMRWWERGDAIELDGIPYQAICPRLALYSGDRRSIRQALVFALACLRLAAVDFDVVEADHMPYIQLFALRLVTWRRRARLIVTWHEAWDRAQWTRYLGVFGNLAWAIERTAMLLPDCIVAASPETGRRVSRAVGERVAVVVAPNGIDADGIDAIVPAADELDVVSVGRLLSHKRFDLLLDALALLAAEGVRPRCLIIGDGPERDRLIEQIRALGLDGHVTLRGDIDSHDALIAHVKAARCFAFPSEREGFGIAALEAIACGTPVVTTAAPDNLAVALVARSTAGVICEPTAQALATAITDQLAPGVAGRPREPEAWIREYDWNASAAAMLRALGVAGPASEPESGQAIGAPQRP